MFAEGRVGLLIGGDLVDTVGILLIRWGTGLDFGLWFGMLSFTNYTFTTGCDALEPAVQHKIQKKFPSSLLINSEIFLQKHGPDQQ